MTRSTCSRSLPRSALSTLGAIRTLTVLLPGPALTSSSTDEPRGRPLPGGGRTESTTSASCPDVTRSTLPTFIPAASRIPSANWSDSPTTSGTATGAGPPLSTSCTVLLGGATISGGGSCQTTAPRGIDGVGALSVHPHPEAEAGQTLAGVRLRAAPAPGAPRAPTRTPRPGRSSRRKWRSRPAPPPRRSRCPGRTGARGPPAARSGSVSGRRLGAGGRAEPGAGVTPDPHARRSRAA